MSLYACSSCMDNIPLHKPRLHCTDCRSHDICASCYVLSISTGAHTTDHRVDLIEKSGTLPLPPPQPPRPLLPPRKSTQSNPVSTPQSQPYARPEVSRSPVPHLQSQQIPQYVTQPIPAEYAGPRQQVSQCIAQSLPPPYAQPQQQQQTPQYVAQPLAQPIAQPVATSGTPTQFINTQPIVQSHGWTPLFEGSEPSALGAHFFSVVFDCLDTQKKGFLTPEQYSAFLTVQGYLPEQDVWKRTNKVQFGYNGEDLADYEFRTILENFSFEFVLQSRPAAPNNDMANLMNTIPNLPNKLSTLLSSSSSLPPLSGGEMPCLTRKGFADITTVEILAEPSVGWRYVSLITNHYRIWKEWGDCPRAMLPEEAPKQLLDRIARVTAYSQKRSAGIIEAKRVELELKQQGQEAALRLLDPPGTRYYYRY